jgi:hypothetical protein
VPLKIEVKSYDPVEKASRQATAQRVIDEFGNGLPDLRLLAFFDDNDWSLFRDEFGKSHRGHYAPIKASMNWHDWPNYVWECIFVVHDPSSFVRKRVFDHVIYLHGSTCAEEVSMIMTLSHELQHFIQYGFNRKLWAENFLLPRLPKEVINIMGLNWPDIPNEREARIVAKRTAIKLCGADAVKQYIDRRISERVTPEDAEDWQFSQQVDPLILYDLAAGTRQIYQRLKAYRRHLEDILNEMREDGDVDFKCLDLSEYFD